MDVKNSNVRLDDPETQAKLLDQRKKYMEDALTNLSEEEIYAWVYERAFVDAAWPLDPKESIKEKFGNMFEVSYYWDDQVIQRNLEGLRQVIKEAELKGEELHWRTKMRCEDFSLDGRYISRARKEYRGWVLGSSSVGIIDPKAIPHLSTGSRSVETS